MTIYVPEDLAVALKAKEDINVSAVCQKALRAELRRRETQAQLSEAMQSHEVYISDRGVDVRFVGKQLVLVQHGAVTVTAYFTHRRRIAVYDDRLQQLREFDTFEHFASEMAALPEIVTAVAHQLGEKHVVDIDI